MKVLLQCEFQQATMGLFLLMVMSIVVFTQSEVGCRKAKGPYEVVYEKIEECEDMGTKEARWSTNITRLKNGNYKMSLHLLRPWDKNIRVCTNILELTSEGYTKHHKFNCMGLGQVLNFAEDYFKGFMAAAGATFDGYIFPVGNYTANNWNAGQPFRNVPVMTYNKFKFTFNYFDKNVKIGCAIFYLEFVPKLR